MLRISAGLATVSIVFIALFGCGKSDDPIYNSCQLTRIVQPGDSSAVSTRFYYDANGALISIQAVNYRIDFTYSGNKIIKEEAGVRTEYTIGPDSTTVSSKQVTDNPSDPIYTVDYFYDENKYLVKTIGYLDGVLWDSSWRVVENGNVIKHTYHQHNTVVDIVNDYSFHTDQTAKLWIYTKLAGEYGYFYYPWLGRPNRNLMKMQSQGSFQLTGQNYILDGSGFISQVIYSSLDSSPPYTVNWSLEHKCE